MNTDLLVSVLKRASQRGATAADGYLVEESRFSASVRMREIERRRTSSCTYWLRRSEAVSPGLDPAPAALPMRALARFGKE